MPQFTRTPQGAERDDGWWATPPAGACHTRAVLWTLHDIALATGGRLHGDGDTTVDGATQDSRDVRPGMLFVPLVAERDGHDFVAQAVAAGAPAYLTARGPSGVDAAAVEVEDTLAALTALAREARGRLGAVPVVGVTGSVGKTTTKDLMAAVLGRDRRVWASIRSFNNEIGVPITLLSAPEDADVLVVEMGSRGPGHIAELCRVARPTMGVVTTVGLSHTSELGSLGAVVSAKQELVEALPAAADGGVAFLNAGVPEVSAMASGTKARVVTYGVGGEVQARDLTVDDELTPRFVLHSPGGEVEVELGARGLHSVDNALAAAAVGLELGVSLEDVAGGLAEPTLSPLRMEVVRAAGGARLLNDCYNANPLSMRAALHALAVLPARRRIAVLGTMAELGDFEAAEHAAVASLAARLDVRIMAVDAPAYSSGDSTVTEVAGIDGALAALSDMGGLGAGDAVLVKGSRVAGLERLVARLVDDADG